MSKKKYYHPIRFVKDFENTNLNIYDNYEETRKNRKGSESNFDTAVNVSKTYYNQYQSTLLQACAVILVTTADWRQNKQVYSFSNELTNSFMKMKNVPIEPSIFSKLPNRTFYIEANIENVHGMFVKYVKDEVNHSLIFILITNELQYGYFIFDFPYHQDFTKTIESFAKSFREKDKQKDIRKALIFGFQAAMYLATNHEDIVENEEQKKIYHEPTKVCDKFSEVRKWDVGNDFLKQVKNVKESMALKDDSVYKNIFRRAYWKVTKKQKVMFVMPQIVKLQKQL